MQIEVLVLEDDNERMTTFRNYCLQHVRTETAPACIAKIQEAESINELWLDHDLGGQVYVDSNREDTGMEVVRFLVANDMKSKIKKIFAHTLNTNAGLIMAEDLCKAGYEAYYFPFTKFRSAVRVNGLIER